MPRPSLSALSASRPTGDLFTWDWGSTTTPAGLTLARSGTVYQISNAAQSTLQSFGTDVWDYEVASDGTRRVYVLPGYTNKLTSPHAYSGSDGNWTALFGTYSAPGGTGPDGSTLTGNHRCQLSSTQTGAYYDHVTSAPLVFSMWVRANGASSGYCAAVEHNSIGAYNRWSEGTATTTWQRISVLSDPVGDARYVVPCESAIVGSTRPNQDVIVDFLQVTEGLYFDAPFTASSVGAKFLAVAGSDLVCSTGYFDVSEYGVISQEDESAGASDRMVLRISSTTYLYIRASDDKWVLRIGGSDVIAVSLGYGAQDLGEIRVWSRADSCGFELPNMGDPPNTAAAQAPIAVPATSYLFSDGSTSASVWPVKLYGADVSGSRCRARNV